MTRVIDKWDLGVAYRPALSPPVEPVVSTPDGASIANADDLPDFPQGFDEIYHERMIYDERYSEN